jgi:hypothetical protein
MKILKILAIKAAKAPTSPITLIGDTLKVARIKYRQFVKNGIAQGTRPDLQCSGLVRNTGGDKRGLLGRKKSMNWGMLEYWGVGI